MSRRQKAAEWFPMTCESRRLVRALAQCSMLPGSPEKRFVRDMNHRLHHGCDQITAKQTEWLRQIAHRYRRQLAAQKAEESA